MGKGRDLRDTSWLRVNVSEMRLLEHMIGRFIKQNKQTMSRRNSASAQRIVGHPQYSVHN